VSHPRRGTRPRSGKSMRRSSAPHPAPRRNEGQPPASSPSEHAEHAESISAADEQTQAMVITRTWSTGAVRHVGSEPLGPFDVPWSAIATARCRIHEGLSAQKSPLAPWRHDLGSAGAEHPLAPRHDRRRCGAVGATGAPIGSTSLPPGDAGAAQGVNTRRRPGSRALLSAPTWLSCSCPRRLFDSAGTCG
jgi:hypothetical protein